jgi:tRNA pseudouridine38-40 synthase
MNMGGGNTAHINNRKCRYRPWYTIVFLWMLGKGIGFSYGWSSTTSTLKNGVPCCRKSVSSFILSSSHLPSEASSSLEERVPGEEKEGDEASSYVPNPPSTCCAILRLSYDGARFFGWSASNDNNGQSTTAVVLGQQQNKNRRRSRHRKSRLQAPTGIVRSVQGVLQECLAKLYGNVDKSMIVVEGCSRTDKGVHATGNIAMIYGVVVNKRDSIIPTKETGECHYLPLPMNGDLSRIAFSMNRMLPPDLRIVGIAPAPNNLPDDVIFHPSISSVSKTYVYSVAVGGDGMITDPISNRWVWQYASTAEGGNKSSFDLPMVQQACQILQGTHNFAAFQGAPRGKTDKAKQQTSSTICTLYSIEVAVLTKQQNGNPRIPAAPTYSVTITGDRFLYKMVRFLVGALVDIGVGKRSVEDLQQALDDPLGAAHSSSTKKLFTTCAPAHGLVLQHVKYGTQIVFDWQPLRN